MATEYQIIEKQFWRLNDTKLWLQSERMKAIRDWNVPELDRLEAAIDENNRLSNTLIDKMGDLATAQIQ